MLHRISKRVLVAVPELLETIARICACLLLIAAIVLNFVNVIGRYFFSSAISWADEIMVFLMIGSTFLALAPLAWRNQHIRMDVVLQVFPERLKTWLDVATTIALTVVGATVVYASVLVVTLLGRLDQRTVAAELPVVIPHSAVLVGFALMAVLMAIRLVLLVVPSNSNAADSKPAPDD